MSRYEYDFAFIFNRFEGLDVNASTYQRMSKTFVNKAFERFGILKKSTGRQFKGFREDHAIPGSNKIKNLSGHLLQSRVIFVVVDPDFLKNFWSNFLQQTSFTTRIRTNEGQRVIPIMLEVSGVQPKTLDEFSASENVWFSVVNDSIDPNEVGWKKLERVLLSSEQNKFQVLNEELFSTVASACVSDDQVFQLGKNLGLDEQTLQNAMGGDAPRIKGKNVLMEWRKMFESTFESDRLNLLIGEILHTLGKEDLAERLRTQYSGFLNRGNVTPVCAGITPTTIYGHSSFNAPLEQCVSIDGETDPVMEENPVEMPTHEPKFVEHGLKQEESRFYQNSQNRNEDKTTDSAFNKFVKKLFTLGSDYFEYFE